MTNRSDLTVALRLQADVADAVKRLGEVARTLDKDTASADALAEAVRAVAASFSGIKLDVSDEALVQAKQRIDALRAAEAGTTLGIRLDKDILGDIQAQQAAFEKLKASGVASAQEIARAEAALQTRVAALNAELGRTPQHLKSAGVSAGQTAAAMLQLPAQITDVVTSLASGSPAWMVLIQQGGQVKDSFGGIGPALKAVTGLITPMRLALAGGVAAVSGLAFAYIEAQRESTALANAVTLSGNVAGKSADQIRDMADQLERLGAGHGPAVGALTALTTSGKILGDQLQDSAGGAVAWSVATGRAIEDVVADFVKLADEPAKASAALNEKYHYLTAAVYEQIVALERQGDAVGAANLAEQAYANAGRQRAEETQRNLNDLERAWGNLGKSIKGTWSDVVGFFQDKTLVQQLEEARQLAADGGGLFLSQADADHQVHVLEAAVEAQKRKNEAAGTGARADAAAVPAINAVTRANEGAASAQDKLNKALKEYRDNLAKIRAANPSSALLDPARIAKTEAAIRAQFTPKASPQKAPGADPIAAKEQSFVVALTEASFRLADAKEGVAAADRQASRELEVWLATSKEAVGLSEQQIALFRAQAAAGDALAKDTRNEQELQAARERAAQGLAGIEADWLAATGRAAEATAQQIEQRFAKLKADLEKTGDTAGLAELKVVIDAEKARASLAQLQAEIERVLQKQGRGEQSIDAQVSAGLITQIEGQTRLVDLHRATAQQIESYLPKLREMAALPGPMGEQARAALQAMETQLIQLRTTTDELQNALRNGLQGGIQQALTGLANGTLSLSDAIRTLMLSVADALAQVATKQLAQMSSDSLMGLFKSPATDAASAAASAASTASSAAALSGAGAAVTSGGAAVSAAAGALSTAASALIPGAAAIQAAAGALATAQGGSGIGDVAQAAAQQIAAIQSVTAASTAADATRAASAVAATTTVAAAQAPAAAATTASWAPAAMVASIGSFGSAAAIGLAAVLAAMAMAKAFDTGGYTGPGGVHEAAGIVHKGEFVTRQAVTHQPGAIPFLSDFNRRGMAALEAWAGWRGYAEGGLVTASPVMAPATSTLRGFQPSAPPAPGKAERDRIKIVNSLDLDHLVKGLDGHAGFDRLVLNVIKVNPGSVQQYMAG